MYVSCEDLLKLPYFTNCTVHTKDIGLKNVISWPYVAKALLFDNIFNGGEFVILAETYVKYDEPILLEFLDICKNNNISGLLFFIDYTSESGLNKLPESVIKKAMEYEIPIFELPWDIRSIDVVKSISFTIFENEHRTNALTDCLKNIVFFDNSVNTDNLIRLQDLDYEDVPYYILRIQLFNYDEFCDSRGITLPVAKHDQKKFIRHMIMNNINYYFTDAIMFFNSNIIVTIIPESMEKLIHDGHTVDDLYQNISNTIKNLNFSIFVSQKYSSVRMIKKAFHETTHLVPLRLLNDFKNKPVLYDKIGIFKVIIALPKETIISIYENTFAPLIEADKKNDNQLMYTLKVYLKNNMNMEDTSNELFLHNNTIRYRLKKIESLTNMSLKSLNDLTMLCYCINIRDYLDINE